MVKKGAHVGMGKPAYYGLLALACLVGLGLVMAPILATGRGPVWLPDALVQQVATMTYEGEALRGAFASLAAGQGFDLPSFVFNTGYGDSVRATMALFDPLKWLSALVPPDCVEYLFYAIIYVRLYLAAVAFSVYCFGIGRAKGSTMVAALCYCFSGFVLFWGALRHPSFINATIMLPLVLWGAERLFRGKGPVAFSVTVALALFLSTYFAYMTAITVVAYALVRFFAFEQDRTLRRFLRTGGLFVLFGALGVAVAGIAVFPEVISLTSMDRVSGRSSVYVPVVNSAAYYGSFVGRMLGTVVTEATAKFVGVVGVMCTAALIVCPGRFDRRRRRSWLAAMVLVALVLLVPRLGSVMNGFNYVTDRWMFIMGFCVANIVCLVLPALKGLDAREWRRLGIVLAVVLVLAVAPAPFDDVLTALPVVAAVLLAAACAVAVLHGRGAVARRGYLAAMAAIAVASAVSTSFFLTNEDVGKGYAKEFLPEGGMAYSMFTDASPFAVVDQLPQNQREQHRYSMSRSPGLRYFNNSLASDRMGLESFHSHYVQSVDDFRNSVGLPDNFFRAYFYGADGRLALEAFSGARYYVSPEKDSWLVPRTYEKTGLADNGRTLYASDYALPLAFCYDTVLSYQEYSKLDQAARQDALLQACVVDAAKIDADAQVADSVAVSAVQRDYRVSQGKGLKWEGNTIRVDKAGASITFDFEALPDAETYLVFENLNLGEGNPDKRSTFDLKVECANGERTYSPRTPYTAQGYSGKDNWICNLGYSADGIGQIVLTFPEAGEYRCDGLRVYCQPVGPLVQDLEKLRERGLADIETDGHGIAGTATTVKDVEYALFTVGYSRGWTAKVDGSPVDIVRAGVGFVGVPLRGAGEHRVELTYQTPGLVPGVALSLAGLVACIACAVGLHLHRRRADERGAGESGGAEQHAEPPHAADKAAAEGKEMPR